MKNEKCKVQSVKCKKKKIREIKRYERIICVSVQAVGKEEIARVSYRAGDSHRCCGGDWCDIAGRRDSCSGG